MIDDIMIGVGMISYPTSYSGYYIQGNNYILSQDTVVNGTQLRLDFSLLITDGSITNSGSVSVSEACNDEFSENFLGHTSQRCLRILFERYRLKRSCDEAIFEYRHPRCFGSHITQHTVSIHLQRYR